MPDPQRHSYTVGRDSEADPKPQPPGLLATLWRIFSFSLLMLGFLLAIEWVSLGFRLFGTERIQNLVALTANPFIGLFLGILATAILQSSSTVTTLVVGVVAAGQLTLISATPIIMGANIGTSVTCLIVALGLIGQREDFGTAISTASLHSLFNIFTVLILLPLEVTTGAFSRFSDQLAIWLYQGESAGAGARGLLDATIRPLADFFVGYTATASFPAGNPYIVLLLGLFALFLALRLLISLFRSRVATSVQARMGRYLFGHPRQAWLTGLLATSLLQSSSVTTSLMVLLSTTTRINLPRIFAFLIGANLGTTITALIAAFLIGTSSETALAIAFAHLLFNCFGALVLYPIPAIRMLPIRIARWLGQASERNRTVAVVFLVGIYFLIPGLLMLLL